MSRQSFAPLSALAAILSLGACTTVPAAPPEPVTVRIAGLNDFHGNLEPIRRQQTVPGANGVPKQVRVAGAAHLASAVAAVRAKGEHSLVIAAGDLIGGSPLVSSYFLDEPAIGAMNRIGLDFNAVGNHEFDRGWRELKRMQDGGCEKLSLREPCAVEPDFSGARFRFLAANVAMPDGTTLFPAFGMREFGTGKRAVNVGVIGLTLKETPTLVTPSGVEGLTFGDEARAINQAVDALVAQGADALVVAIHQGLYTEVGYNDKSCGGVSGPLIDILREVDPRVDLVISGHTHRAYVCDFAKIDPARTFLVTSAGYGGSYLTDIALTIDPARSDVIAKSADNVVVQVADGSEVADFGAFLPNGEVSDYVARYVAAAEDAASRPVGRISGPAPDPGPATEETQLGNLIADAQLFGTRAAGAEIALMNNSGIRVALTPSADGTVTYGDIYAVQPFGNTLVTKTFTGAQLVALLEQQFDDDGFVQTFSTSEGFNIAYDMRRPAGSRLVSATLQGKPIDPARTYRVTMNSFLAAGGDSFTVFTQGTETVIGAVDLDAMEEYLRAVDVRQLPPLGRVREIR
ncbi:Endonuclease YhcR precursor [Tsuneonella dongtanensis]|uniref:Endonuclease YhcR n=1 Tax=Tsuneonella dongtanensis TaxID=692370 RepID=A0A1B2AAR0_9SPHN|nr:bifunctional UDP-sugar hydrolase/5'-nucleotidase [Tsuneonella dongtanensis]ANY19250.1 Endonuclease YhcR precursor [Tsuneonella dongtanensis]